MTNETGKSFRVYMEALDSASEVCVGGLCFFSSDDLRQVVDSISVP
jgi:hypothetical protein